MMNPFKLFLVLIMMQSFNITAQNLSDYRWKNRILVLFENDSNSKKLNNTLNTIKKNTAEFKERDLLVFIYTDELFFDINGKATNLKNSTTLPKSHDGYILIGKDGGIKATEPYPIQLEKLWDLIDGMPMRKNEMRQKNN